MKKALDREGEKLSNFNLQSAVIDFLRFPLIIGVLLIHNTPATVYLGAGQIGNSAWLPVSTICRDFFSQTLGHLSVPAFFFISGFLFFLHIDKFTGSVYVKKLKSRARTLLVPYLFWNILSLAVVFVAYRIKPLLPFFSKTREFTWRYLLQALWALPKGDPSASSPFAFQFWFIRDLMVMMLLTPVIYLIVKKFQLWTIAIFGILWFFEWWRMYLPWLDGHGLSIIALFFFTTGAWFAVNKRNFIDDAERVAKWAFVLYPPIAIADLLTKLHIPNTDPVYLPFVHNSGILVGIAASFALAAYLLKTGKTQVNAFLASASFFVFAVHEPLFLGKLRKAVFVIFRPESDAALAAVYFLLVIVVAVVALGLYWLLQRFLPGFTRVITGGR